MGTSKAMIPSLAKLRVSINTLNGAILVASANLIIWSEVWRAYQDVMGTAKVTTEDVEAAQANLLRVQEETAKKFGVTLEVFQEWQKSGKAINEISEDVAAVLKKLGAEKAFEKLKEDARELRSQLNSMKTDLSTMKIGSEEWQILSQNIEETEQALTDLHQKMTDLRLSEGIVENAKIIKTTVADITLDINLLAKEFELTGKSVEESATYYGILIEKLNAVDVILQTELMLLKEGTKAYKEKQAEIFENAKAIGEIEENLKKLIEPLAGLELIAAKMALLGDSTTDTKAKIELLNEKAVLLQQALDEAIPDTEAWWEAKIAFEENQVAIDGLTEKLSELTEEEKEAIEQAEKLADAYKSITDKIYELTHTPMENAIRKLDEQKQEYIDLGVEIGIVNEWYALQIEKLQELNPELDKNIEKLEETAETTEKLGVLGGKSWEGITTQIKHATVALNSFTREAVAAAITQIKMNTYKLIQHIRETTQNATGIFKAMAEANIAMLENTMRKQIDVIMYGYNTYLDVLEGLGGATDNLAGATTNAANSMVSSWGKVKDVVADIAETTSAVATTPGGWGITSYQHGTPYVPRTGIYKLERGERVTPANQNTYNNTFSPTVNLTVQGGGGPNRIAQEVENVLYDMGRQFKRRGFEMVPGRG